MSCIIFLFNQNLLDTSKTVASLSEQQGLDRIVVLVPNTLPLDQRFKADNPLVSVEATEDSTFTTSVLKQINAYGADYTILYTKTSPLSMGYRAIARMLAVCPASNGLVYADYSEIKAGATQQHPLIEYQTGSVRNDFEFGSVQMYSGAFDTSTTYRFAALYAEQLRRQKNHVPEFLYTEEESDLRKSGEKQFDYVNPAMREVQIEMEQAFTAYLCEQGLLISPEMIRRANFDVPFALEASVIIPVRNRVKTIADAIHSVLEQQASFEFNVIVVDNHSTDGTTEAIEAVASQDKRVVHLVPTRNDLGIGGCWDYAIRSEYCGKFAVQLDSDDLYSGPDTLQKVVDKFYETNAAMVIGSYSLVNFDLQPLPPGLIDHREWTDTNGMNNALRINGLGAPRAFFVPVLRQIGFPNTSYGEDYAVGLAISRQYRIGRIYDNLYLCRRWNGNSDAALSVEKVNKNNLYKDWIRTQEIAARRMMLNQDISAEELDQFFREQLGTWPEVAQRFDELDTKVEKQAFTTADGIKLEAQFNPARIRSTGAKVDSKSIAQRKCFLCQENQPALQMHRNYKGTYQFCINPFPILHKHFTVPLKAHRPQLMAGRFDDLQAIVEALPDMVVFYNGAQCGASAPDHFHFQAGAANEIPLQRDLETYLANATQLDEGIWYTEAFVYPLFVTTDAQKAQRVIKLLPKVGDEAEPRFNIIATKGRFVIIPRRKLRPECYFAEGEANMCISPGAVDMGGLIITPMEKDFRRLTPEIITSILQEVTLSIEETSAIAEMIKQNRK